MSNNDLKRELQLPPAAISLLEAMGVKLPGNVKEITTETIVDDSIKQIALPKGMSKLAASEELHKQYINEEQVVDFVAEFPDWNWKDVLVAIKKVTENTFGWLNAKSGWSNPTEIDIVVDIKEGKKVTDKAFIGNFKVTTWDDANASIGIDKKGMVYLSVSAKRKHSAEVTEYFNLIRTHLEEELI